MDVHRKVINLIKMDEDTEDGCVKADMAELMSWTGEITEDVRSFVKNQNLEAHGHHRATERYR